MLPPNNILSAYVTATPLGTGERGAGLLHRAGHRPLRDRCEWSNALKGAAEKQSATTTSARMIGPLAAACIEEIQNGRCHGRASAAPGHLPANHRGLAGHAQTVRPALPAPETCSGRHLSPHPPAARSRPAFPAASDRHEPSKDARAHAAGPGGVTLIELLVAITLDLIIVAAVAGLLSKNSKYRNDVERSASRSRTVATPCRCCPTTCAGRIPWLVRRPQRDVGERRAVRRRLSCTTFWPRWNPWVANGAVLLDPCATDVPTLNNCPALSRAGLHRRDRAELRQRRQGQHRHSSSSDAASSCVAGPAVSADCPMVANATYFQASSCNLSTELGAPSANGRMRVRRDTTLLDRTKRDCTTIADFHQLYTHSIDSPTSPHRANQLDLGAQFARHTGDLRTLQDRAERSS